MATVNAVNTYIVPTTANEVTMPSQPAFLAVKDSMANNVTGNGAAYTIDWTQEYFDQNADYNTGTFTFTAPVTAKYEFTMIFQITNIGAANNGNYYLITSNRTYSGQGHNWNNFRTGPTAEHPSFEVLADLDAADTAYVTINLTGQGANTIGIGFGGGFPAGSPYSYFTGVLIC